MIKLRDDVVFNDPQSRIHEYCLIEIYRGYDDKHSTDDYISKEDVDAANLLYAMIDRYDKNVSKRLLDHSEVFSEILSQIPNQDIHTISDEEWFSLIGNISKLLRMFLQVKGIGLAKATKILHLKRPKLFPVLDSYVIKFLLGIDLSDIEKMQQADAGLKALERVRLIVRENRVEFEKLIDQTRDLPIPLTTARMFDILCWTAEKWDIRGKLSAPYGIPSKSLLQNLETLPEVRTIRDEQYVVFEDLERATGPKVHQVGCFYYQRWLVNPTTTTTWHGPYGSLEEAWEICKRLAHRSRFEPSKHRCVR